MDVRNQNLDLLRALAIILVFVAHLCLSFGGEYFLNFLQFGGTGVDLFFMLSGWLIGTQIFQEIKKYGNLDIKRFWVRRWLRTMPAYFAVLFILLTYLSLSSQLPSQIWPYFLFIQNYTTDMPFFYVSWSLSVEEQFYLLIAPLAFYIQRFSSQLRTLILFTLAMTPSLFRALGWYEQGYESHIRWDCCILGVILAQIHAEHKNIWQKLKQFMIFYFLASFCIYFMFFYFRSVNVSFPLLGEPSPLVLAFIFIPWIYCAHEVKISFKKLPCKIINFISKRSYAIYLLHPTTLALSHILGLSDNLLSFILFTILTTLICSEVLYRTIEMPFINLRSKYQFSCHRKAVKEFSKESSIGSKVAS